MHDPYLCCRSLGLAQGTTGVYLLGYIWVARGSKFNLNFSPYLLCLGPNTLNKVLGLLKLPK